MFFIFGASVFCSSVVDDEGGCISGATLFSGLVQVNQSWTMGGGLAWYSWYFSSLLSRHVAETWSFFVWLRSNKVSVIEWKTLLKKTTDYGSCDVTRGDQDDESGTPCLLYKITIHWSQRCLVDMLYQCVKIGLWYEFNDSQNENKKFTMTSGFCLFFASRRWHYEAEIANNTIGMVSL